MKRATGRQCTNSHLTLIIKQHFTKKADINDPNDHMNCPAVIIAHI